MNERLYCSSNRQPGRVLQQRKHAVPQFEGGNMPTWLVQGMDRETGEPRQLRVEAQSEQDAVIHAGKEGMVVELVRDVTKLVPLTEPTVAWQHSFPHPSRLVATLICAGLLFFVASIIFGFVRARRDYHLPTVDHVCQKLKVWSLPPTQDVRRGRPVTVVPVAPDASKPEESIEIWLDENGQPIGMMASVVESPVEGHLLLGESKLDALNSIAWSYASGSKLRENKALVVYDLASKYGEIISYSVPLMPVDIQDALDDGRIKLLQIVHDDPDTKYTRELHVIYSMRGLTIEYKRMDFISSSSETDTARLHTWIIRSW
ncbi:MAG: hypothetical protein IT445_00070 [Phycisphaeraceae bacterium]|nr:hypothetical protein [Phycisphaeraceae bacterium]